MHEINFIRGNSRQHEACVYPVSGVLMSLSNFRSYSSQHASISYAFSICDTCGYAMCMYINRMYAWGMTWDTRRRIYAYYNHQITKRIDYSIANDINVPCGYIWISILITSSKKRIANWRRAPACFGKTTAQQQSTMEKKKKRKSFRRDGENVQYLTKLSYYNFVFRLSTYSHMDAVSRRLCTHTEWMDGWMEN